MITADELCVILTEYYRDIEFSIEAFYVYSIGMSIKTIKFINNNYLYYIHINDKISISRHKNGIIYYATRLNTVCELADLLDAIFSRDQKVQWTTAGRCHA